MDETKTQFLNTISHEIRTPMNAIIGYTTLAKQHFSDADRVWEYLEKISVASTYLLGLIEDCLDMRRMENGEFELENTACNLKKVMDDLETVMIGQMEEKNLHFHMDTIKLRDADVLCDRKRLNQILMNVVENALKYTPEGGDVSVQVSQEATCENASCARYRFRVKDNGIGMSEAYQAHLFEPFSQEKNSTESGIPGIGLGLAITKRIVDRMDGKISVSSKPGEGTEVVIELEFPLQELSSPKPELENAALEKHRLQVARKLLLVEDNLLNQEIAAEILTDHGFEIEVANNGSEAVEMVSRAQPGYYNAVLMDVQMPIMNGYEATRRIRMLNNKLLSNIPIIAMTANALEEDRRKALDAGMDDFVAKPIDVEKLLDALNEHCA